MTFNRNIDLSLAQWRVSPSRKPLVIRGARQVGKTTAINKFGGSFDHFIGLNLERAEHRKYFEDFDDVKTITEALFLAFKIPEGAIGNTLLFVDEIQELPKAIHLLRYFYEDMPRLHVVAAGSLLEFALKSVQGFPVGRVEFMYLHPLSFDEFLEAVGHSRLLKELVKFPTPQRSHTTLMAQFHRYAIIGGMPEVVRAEIDNLNLSRIQTIYESIWETYRNDIEKYTKSEPSRRVIKHVISTAPLAVDERIKFQGFGNSNYKSREVGEALRSLEDARILQLIYPTTEVVPPIKPDLKKSPRLQFVDTGLVNYVLGIQGQMLSIVDLNSAHRGAIIPHLIGQEIISTHRAVNYKPSFWVREKKQSNSEVDWLIQKHGQLIPIEVKSGAAGALRSLHQFMDQVPHTYAVRMYGGEFKVDVASSTSGKRYWLLSLPYFLGTQLNSAIDWLLDSYPEQPINESGHR